MPKANLAGIDANAFYGYIFTLVNDPEADYLIQNITVIDDGQSKSLDLLKEVKERIQRLEIYTDNLHSVHNYTLYHSMIDKLIEKACR